MTPSTEVLARAAQGPVDDRDAFALSRLDTASLCEAARARRDGAWGRVLTFSPKIFLPITNLCRNRCSYCSFRRSPGDPGEWTMSPAEVDDHLAQGAAQGCVEALFCLGDTPETGFRAYRTLLSSWGHDGTVDYLEWAGERALARGLLPHTNAGILSRDAMTRLRRVNVSLGLMLENVSDRLCARGMPHHKAPDKRPVTRIAMTREAGELRIPFTSGLLIGIGETLHERVATLLTIRALHREHSHIQEVIIQNFRANETTPMGAAPEPSETDLAHTIALARLILDDDVSVQAPPNLSPASIPALIDAGLNDFGGVSPVTPDYINPGHPWPHLQALGEACIASGFQLKPRLPVYERFLGSGEWIDPPLELPAARAQRTLAGMRVFVDGAGLRDGAPNPLDRTTPAVRKVLDRCLSGDSISWKDAVLLSTDADLHALCFTADEVRRRQVGDRVSYVVNRNINFTNVCIKNCHFCAFARGVRSEQGYYLPVEEVVRRALQAQDMGATEVCLQAGLSPNITGDTYIDLCRAVRDAAPELHIHAFSPEELKFGAALKGVSVAEYLAALKEAGLGSLPGTSAEVLDDSLRDRIAPQRLTTKEWLEVITAAHELGIRTTSTLMFGHVETVEQRMRHMDLLRRVQRETGGFTEFVPLSFVHEESPLFLTGEVAGVRAGPTGDDVIRLYAVARLMLGDDIANLQASWVKEGLRVSQWLLHCGVNDLGGSLMNESISTSAGARHGQLMRPSTLRRVIRDADRVPVERNTLYGVVREFGADAANDALEPLDHVDDPDEIFGSYRALTHDPRFAYEPRGGRLRVVR